MHFVRGTLKREHYFNIECRLDFTQQLTPVGPGNQGAFVLLVRVAEFDTHKETIEL